LNSSSAKVVPYPTVYVRQESPLSFIRASRRAESTPPLSSSPRGTSLKRCLLTDRLYRLSNSSVASPADFMGENGVGLKRYHRRTLSSPSQHVSRVPGASFRMQSKIVCGEGV